MSEQILYSAGGIGDGLIIYCKLYNLCIKENITLHHCVGRPGRHKALTDILSMLPNSNIIIDDRWTTPHITGEFSTLKTDPMPEGIKTKYFPTLPLSKPNKFNIDKYAVLFHRSGAPNQTYRTIPALTIKQIVDRNMALGLQTVSISNYPIPADINIIDMGHLSLMEVLWIAANAKIADCFQGIAAFICLSQKIETSLYFQSNDDHIGIINRVSCSPWSSFVKECIRI